MKKYFFLAESEKLSADYQAYVVGDFNEWNESSHEMKKVEGGWLLLVEILYEPVSNLKFKYLVRKVGSISADGEVKAWMPAGFGSHLDLMKKNNIAIFVPSDDQGKLISIAHDKNHWLGACNGQISGAVFANCNLQYRSTGYYYQGSCKEFKVVIKEGNYYQWIPSGNNIYLDGADADVVTTENVAAADVVTTENVAAGIKFCFQLSIFFFAKIGEAVLPQQGRSNGPR